MITAMQERIITRKKKHPAIESMHMQDINS